MRNTRAESFSNCVSCAEIIAILILVVWAEIILKSSKRWDNGRTEEKLNTNITGLL